MNILFIMFTVPFVARLAEIINLFVCLCVCLDANCMVVGNATRVPGNPKTRVNPQIFKPVNPGLCAGKNPGFL